MASRKSKAMGATDLRDNNIVRSPELLFEDVSLSVTAGPLSLDRQYTYGLKEDNLTVCVREGPFSGKQQSGLCLTSAARLSTRLARSTH
jgi:hypothetical protein